MDIGSGVERRIVTVLFADLVGFTPLSESLDAEDVATVQDAYFAAARETMLRHGGHIEKFIGDAVMAVFGLSRAREDDPERAVAAGLALVSAVEQLSSRLGLEAGTLQLRVGVNTGEVVVAESGPDRGRITGDIVNVAARLQGAAEPSSLLVGELTAFSVADAVELDPVPPLELKGKGKPVHAAVARHMLPRPERSRAMGELRGPIVGREAELEQILAGLTDVDASGGWVIIAPPGVGKSRLLAELGERAATRGARVLRTQVPHDGGSPFEPVATLLLAALRSLVPDAAHPLRSELVDRLHDAGVAPRRAEVLADECLGLLASDGDKASGSLPPAADRDQRFAAWIEALDALTATPALWLIEDIHWAEPDLLAFLGAVTSSSRPGRLVVTSARPSLLERAPSWAADPGGRGLRRLDLEPLPALDAAELVRALIGDALPKPLVDSIVRRSDGNALFIEELLRSWISIGTLVHDAHGWLMTRAPEDVSLPSTVLAIYAAQLDDLPSDARHVARRAAVAGRRFLRESLSALGCADQAALAELRTRALLHGPQPAPLGDAFAYRHALLREAGYASLARVERADLHVRLAVWLMEAASTRLDLVAAEIAHHLHVAHESMPALASQLPVGIDRDRLGSLAAEWLERAAAASLAMAAPETAAQQLRRALELTQPAASADLARRWLLLGEAIGVGGNADESIAALDEAAGRYEAELPALAARDGYSRAVALRATLRIEQLAFREAAEVAAAALAVLDMGRDDLPIGRLLHVRAWARIAYSLAELDDEDLRRAAAIAAEAGDRRLELDSRYLLDVVRAERQALSPEEERQGLDRMLELALEIGSHARATQIMRVLAMASGERGDAVGAAEWLARAAEIGEAHGLTEEIAWCDYVAAEVAFALGDWPSAWRHGLRALELAERHAYHRPTVRTWFVLTAMAAAQGDVEQLTRAYAWFDTRRDTFPDSPFGRLMHGAVDARAGRLGVGPSYVAHDAVLDFWDESPGLPSAHAAAEELIAGWLEAGRNELAAAAMERIRRWRPHRLATPLFLASADLMEAWIVLKQGDAPAARTLASRCLEGSRALGAAWWTVRAARALESAGAASAADLAEAATLGAGLGLTGTAGTAPTP